MLADVARTGPAEESERSSQNRTLARRRIISQLFRISCTLITWVAMIVLGVLVYHVVKQGIGWLDWEFLTNFASRFPERAGIRSALIGSIWIIVMTAVFAVPVGVATAVYLEEYAPRNRWVSLIEINIANLAGMPSVVYGLLGLAIFVRGLGLDRSIWSGSMTLALLVLPVIVIAAREAVHAVPQSIRQAAYAMGARRWQVVFMQVVPAAMPGILTGIILSISRAMGEAAPLLLVGAVAFISFTPTGPSDPFTVLPVQVFNWAARPQEEFHALAAAGILVLLVLTFVLNFGAIMLRHRMQKIRSRI